MPCRIRRLGPPWRAPGRAPGHRASAAACRVAGMSAPVATKGHHHETARRRCAHPRVSVAHRRAASWVAPPPPLSPPPHPHGRRRSLFLSLASTDRWEKKWKGARVRASAGSQVLFGRYWRRTVDRDSTTGVILDSIRPRWAPRLAAQAFVEACSLPGDLGRTSLKVWAEFCLAFFDWVFLFFLICYLAVKSRKLVNDPKLRML
jgi:hypothetical protein